MPDDIKKTPLCQNLPLMRDALLSWYGQHARDLPWRHEQDPYRIWLSEIMLQQTRVDTVIPYYKRFIQNYPTSAALSAAKEEEVLKLWEGLGYYARARNFHEAIQEIQSRYGGGVPSEPEEFRRLPGVGDYTAAAVMSIAYGIPLAAVDGNIKRVISRLFGLHGALQRQSTVKEVKKRAADLLDTKRPGDFNQALMDLGASICTPRNPSCSDCPLKLYCLALSQDTADVIPPKRNQKPLPLVEVTAVIIVDGPKCLIRQRPRAGLLGGLWELPTLGPDALTAVQVTLGKELAVFHHQFSHLRWQVSLCHGTLHGEPPAAPPWRWVTAAELIALPFPTVYHPAVEVIRKALTE
jgi:A/G-specific adenine glycosylase